MLKEEALIYLSMGWGVYPAHYVTYDGLCTCGRLDCPTPGKHPMGRWTDFQSRLPTQREVETWFGTALECNIGTVTGQVSGIAVIDVDGSEGIGSARKLNLAPTLTAKTGGGGLHYYYTISGAVPSRVKIMPGIDVRGDGGYVVLPPSVHRSGRRYEWVEPRRMEPFDPEPFERHTSRSISGRNTPNWYDELLKGVDKGSRSVSAARLAGRYFNLGMTYEEIYLLLSTWNEERNSPPLEDFDLRRTIVGVQRKHESAVVPVQIATFEDIQDLLKGAANGRK